MLFAQQVMGCKRKHNFKADGLIAITELHVETVWINTTPQRLQLQWPHHVQDQTQMILTGDSEGWNGSYKKKIHINFDIYT